MTTKYEDQLIYETNATIHAAVEVIDDLAIDYMNDIIPHHEFYDKLIKFFCDYDRLRTDQVESLTKQLTEALQWSVRPMQSGPVE